MAEIVGAFCMPHDPYITAAPPNTNQEQLGNVRAAFARVAERIAELKTTTVITIGSDHYCMFGPQLIPAYAIGIGDLTGPMEPWMGIEQQVVNDNREMAQHILQYGSAHGFDWAASKTMCLDHGTILPIELAVTPAGKQIKNIPIYISSTLEPFISMKRSHELGKCIGDAVRAWPQEERVVILGTGGISHWVGTREMGKVNPEFDHQVLDLTEKGDLQALMKLEDGYILEHGGNGAQEIKNWVCAMSTLPSFTGETYCYEPMPELITGLGIAELIV